MVSARCSRRASTPTSAAPRRDAVARRRCGACCEAVPDPEMPVVSVVELGIVRASTGTPPIRPRWSSCVTPTYSGCPATEVIASTIRDALDGGRRRRACALETQLAPAWTTDWIAPEARTQAARLRHRAARRLARVAAQARSTSPACARRVARRRSWRARAAARSARASLSQFGSTACKAQYRCDACLEPFDYFKPHWHARPHEQVPSADARSGRARDARRRRAHVRRARRARAGVPLRGGPAPHLRATIDGAGRPPLVLDLLDGAGRRAAHRGQEEPRRRVLDLGRRVAGGRRRARRDAAAGPFRRRADATRARRHYVGFAAGSGITPLLSIVSTTLAAEPESEFTLFYGNRASGTVMFRDELAELKDPYLTRFNLVHVLSREAQDIPLLHGRIDREKAGALLDALGRSRRGRRRLSSAARTA